MYKVMQMIPLFHRREGAEGVDELAGPLRRVVGLSRMLYGVICCHSVSPGER